MKKIIALCLFTFVMLMGTQNTVAQEKYKNLEESSKIESQNLKKVLILDDDQTAMVYRAIYAQKLFYAQNLSNKELSVEQSTQIKEKVDMNFKSKMIQILTEEQFAKYSAYLSEKVTKE